MSLLLEPCICIIYIYGPLGNKYVFMYLCIYWKAKHCEHITTRLFVLVIPDRHQWDEFFFTFDIINVDVCTTPMPMPCVPPRCLCRVCHTYTWRIEGVGQCLQWYAVWHIHIFQSNTCWNMFDMWWFLIIIQQWASVIRFDFLQIIRLPGCSYVTKNHTPTH